MSILTEHGWRVIMQAAFVALTAALITAIVILCLAGCSTPMYPRYEEGDDVTDYRANVVLPYSELDIIGLEDAVIQQQLMIVALTIWGEARGESLAGKHVVASQIWWDAKGNPTDMASACLKKGRYSYWNGRNSNNVSAPAITNPIDQRAWNHCLSYAGQLCYGQTFEPYFRERMEFYQTNTCPIRSWHNGLAKVPVGKHVVFLRMMEDV